MLLCYLLGVGKRTLRIPEHPQCPPTISKRSPNRRKVRRLRGAKTRAGGCCQVRAEPGKARCRFHGGKSTGPKTEAGRARIAEAQGERWRACRVEDARAQK